MTPLNQLELADLATATTDELIALTHRRQLQARRQIFSRDLPFSWPRFIVGFVSLALVFSDIPRSGLGIRSLDAVYPRVETDTANFFGSPWNYTVFESTRDDAAGRTARVWSYKFDSTSIIWRAFARYLDVPAYPACLLYQFKCPAERFSGTTAFAMIDALVNTIDSATRTRRRPASTTPASMTLRSENVYIDRVHNFLLPGLFPSRNWRTNQALYFSPVGLSDLRAAEVCFPTRPAPVPSLCQEHWINFRRSCLPSDLACQEVGLVYVHTLMRVKQVTTRFPNLTVDLAIMESQEDLQSGSGSLSALGVRRADVTTVIRARRCSGGSSSAEPCETLYVNDYRYEVGLLVSDAMNWYKLVASLRCVGQAYFIVRALGLMLSCYHAQSASVTAGDSISDSDGFVARLHRAYHLFIKVPTQCVVFGSPSPIVLYTMAHAVDASLMYAVLENRFISQNGVLDLSFSAFVSVAVVQMRSVWLFALLWHAAVASATWSRWSACSHLSGGIRGVPEFLLSGMAGLTVISQLRSTAFRSARILRIHELQTPSGGGSILAVLRQNTFSDLGSGAKQLGGILIDVKFLLCMVGLLAAALFVRSLVLIALEARRTRVHTSHWPLGTTPVPYSAGVLWPTVSLCVHWTSDFYCIHEDKRTGSMARRLSRKMTRVLPASLHAVNAPSRQSYHRRQPMSSPSVRLLAQPSTLLSASVARMSLQTFSFIQRQMERLDARGQDVEANVAFMNLVLLSDPVVYFYMCVAGGGRALGFYQSKRDPERVLLLPVAVVGDANEHTASFRKLRERNAAEMPWAELIQCG